MSKKLKLKLLENYYFYIYFIYVVYVSIFYIYIIIQNKLCYIFKKYEHNYTE